MSERGTRKRNKNIVAIEIGYGGEFRVQCGDVYNRELFFHPSYQKAVRIISDIHRANQKVDLKCENFMRDGMHANNIVMFCANRGGGKSSALLTFGKALGQKKEEQHRDFWGDALYHCKFELLDVIDPTLMMPQDSFMRLLLSKMFVKYKKYREENRRQLGMSRTEEQYRSSSEQRILELFRTCHQYLDVLTGRSKDTEYFDDLQLISEIGDSSNLRVKFQELVECYLRERTGMNPKNGQAYLVLQIDDVDLNTDCAYNMIEDIRKYCMIPNVLVLMAVHMDQMQQIVEQHFASAFSPLLAQAKTAEPTDNAMSIRDCREMAVRYMDKVLPAGHQIHLPQISWFIRNESSRLTVRHLEEGIGWENGIQVPYRKDWLQFPNRDNGYVEGYQERLLRLLYNKTGIALVKPMTYVHNLLPQSMRELTHFLGFLSRLEDVDHSLSPAQLCRVLRRRNKSEDRKDQSVEIYHKRNVWEARELSVAPGRREPDYTTGEVAYDEAVKDYEPIQKAQYELEKREHNLKELEQYFFDGWCRLRLRHQHNELLKELRNAVSAMKNFIVQGRCEELWGTWEFDDRQPPLTKHSYARIQEQLEYVYDRALQETDPDEKFQILYAIRFYYTIFLYREALACIARDGNMEQLKTVVNYEAWSPRYSDLTEDSEFGRFQVSANALSKLLGHGGGGSAADNRAWDIRQIIARQCIVRVGGNEVYPVDYKGWETIRDQKSTIVYDLGICLLNYVCQREEFRETQVAVVDSLLQLLLNWDIQHQAKKIKFIAPQLDGAGATQSKVKYGASGLGEWSVNLLLTMDLCVQEATEQYLPCHWCMGDISQEIFGNKLLMTNYEVACTYVEKILGEIQAQLEKEGLNVHQSDVSDEEGPEEVRQALERLIAARSTLNSGHNKLQEIKAYSPTIKTLCDTWTETVLKSSNELTELLGVLGDANYQDKVSEARRAFAHGWQTWLTRWRTVYNGRRSGRNRVVKEWMKDLENYIKN